MVHLDIVALRGILQSTHCPDAQQNALIREQGKHADAELVLLAKRLEAAKAVVDSIQQQIALAEKITRSMWPGLFSQLCSPASLRITREDLRNGNIW